MVRRILVVDDDHWVRKLIVQALTALDVEVVGVATVAGGRVATGPWDLLILDRRLPDGDGREVAAHWLEVPALFVSGLEEADIPKPFTFDELLAAVERKLAEAT